MSQKPLLVCREKDEGIEPSFRVFCVGYEDSRWRAEELVRDFFNRHLTSFALNYSEWKKIDGDSAARALSRSARMVYTTDKYQRRGEFGELFLHGILRDFYDAEPAVSKIYFADGPNETAKGFDSVHVVVRSDGELDLWLGEAKLYTDMRAAIREIVNSLREHVENDFLRKEFLAVGNKLDTDWPYYDKLSELLDENTSLDETVERLVVPVLLTYQSGTIGKHDRVDETYVQKLREEARSAWEMFKDDLEIQYPVTVHLIVLPLEDTNKVRCLADAALKAYQAI